jgi:hypothetical protein
LIVAKLFPHSVLLHDGTFRCRRNKTHNPSPNTDTISIDLVIDYSTHQSIRINRPTRQETTHLPKSTLNPQTVVPAACTNNLEFPISLTPLATYVFASSDRVISAHQDISLVARTSSLEVILLNWLQLAYIFVKWIIDHQAARSWTFFRAGRRKRRETRIWWHEAYDSIIDCDCVVKVRAVLGYLAYAEMQYVNTQWRETKERHW